MTRGELVSRLERDHARLRGKAAVLRSLALGVLRGDADLGETLVLKGRDLQESLIAHMDWEDDVLLPNLRRGSDDALRVAERIYHEHAGQRIELLGSILSLGPREGATGDNGRGAGPREIGKVANGLLELIDRLEQDMATEESVLDALPGSDRSLVDEAGRDQ
jgi:hypothetical protein